MHCFNLRSSALVLISALCAMLSFVAYGQYTFAVVGKTKSDSFYEQSFKGCQDFAQRQADLRCIYDGAYDYQDARTQALVVQDLVAQGVDGILVSTTDSQHLVNRALKKAQEQGIAVITFDSDLAPQHQTYRLAYVGTNNFDFGVALGEAAKQFKREHPQTLCIQSGHHTTPNLNKRIDGVRYALSGSTKRLNGESGWLEHPRCPLFTAGRRDDALKQLRTIISYPQPTIFVAVAGFAQFNPDYQQVMTEFKQQLAKKQRVIISADTETLQLQALASGLGTMNIGQNPYEMGRKGAQLLYDAVKHQHLPEQEQYYLPFHYCTPDNAQSCAKNH
ncbi:hypothetical protein W04_0730 [Pseudoalteromonas sp. SW0106-04]|uniref:substrate-binding domain-containing protein n=1 Tax=Pseudoalteromonas sp. SW0106-04 TaxID=1702169 RepID=UPI0006C358B7|nr:substrate-binding domain-containing protein [Pseudoalteromonas sp. SW0106-04]GAP74218.1 hypothetical protein W04_0730 [Pseudoalteromonas sp. SW0106-04]